MRLARAVAILVAVVSVLAPSRSTAQTPVWVGPMGVIARVPVDTLPGAATEVWFLRVTLQPGASFPVERQTGWSLVAVEQGALMITSDQPLTVERAGSPVPPALRVMVDAGAATLLPLHARFDVRNPGPEPASGLLLLVLSGAEEVITQQTAEAGTAAAAEPPTGIDARLIAAAGVGLGAGPGELTIERAELDPGTTRDQATPTSVELGGIEQGLATVAVVSGEVLVWPQLMAGVDNPSRTVRAGSSVVLAAGDGYSVLPGSRVRWAATGAATLVSLRATVAEAPPTATPER